MVKKKPLFGKFNVVLEDAEEGGYTAYVPALPGCISEGDTIEDSLANIREAMELYLEDVKVPSGKRHTKIYGVAV